MLVFIATRNTRFMFGGRKKRAGAAGRGFCRIQAASWCSFRYSSVQLNEMFCGSLCLSLTRAVALPLARFPSVHLLVAPRSMQQFFMVRIQAKIMFSYSRVRNLVGQWAENKWTATERVAVTVGVVQGDVCGWGGVCVCVSEWECMCVFAWQLLMLASEFSSVGVVVWAGS